MSTTAFPKRPAVDLRLRGEVVRPGDPRWDDSRRAYNLAVDQRPALVAIPADENDVAAVVRYAAANGFQVAAQRTGHNAAPLGALDETILLRTDALQGVEVDRDARRARVRSGAKWADVVPQASELGLAALHGSTPDVSIAGYALGGGVGWYARKHGLAANSVRAIELVTADGELVRVDHDEDPELFFALRGGGGNFGVVTALEIDLYPIAEVYAGVLFFPWERASEVLHAWLDWTRELPDEVTSVGRILQFPPFPQIPEPLRGQKFAIVEAVYVGDEAAGAALLEPLRRLGPAIDTFAMVPPAGIAELHMDPPHPTPYVGEGFMLGDLDHAAIDRFVAVAGPDSGSPLVSAEIRHLGGALQRPAVGHGALATLDAEFITFSVGILADAALMPAFRAQLDTIAAAFAACTNGREYLNFTEVRTDPARFYTPETYARLRAVKARVDPDEVFRANHRIPPAG
jgi:FAD/FMN-containing dehydrogenase